MNDSRARKKIAELKRQADLKARRASQMERERKKASLRAEGCHLPFYEAIDSFEEEFHRLAKAAAKDHPSLVAVREVPEHQVRSVDWLKATYPDFTSADMQVPESAAGYGEHDGTATAFDGKASFYWDANGELRSVVLIQRDLRCSGSRDFHYGLKIATLFHELGHVHDAENRLHLKLDGSEADIVAIEVYAHCNALARLADHCMPEIYEIYYGTLASGEQLPGYAGEIVRTVLSRHPKQKVRTWQA
ncbi:MAG: hypothetical protein ACTHK7_10455 [Aureliella sp.]